jgi:hypothetical protein
MAKIKIYGDLTYEEQQDLETLNALKEILKTQLEHPNSDPSFKQLERQISRLTERKRKADEKAQEKLARAKLKADKLQAQLDKQEKIEKEKQARIEVKEQKMIDSTTGIDTLISAQNIWQSGARKSVWMLQEVIADSYGRYPWTSLDQQTLLNRFAQLRFTCRSPDGTIFSAFEEFRTKMQNIPRLYNTLTMTYDPPGPMELNILHTKFCEMHPTDSDYHWFFDAEFESVSGELNDPGCKEQLENLIYWKYTEPSNIMIPHIACSDLGRTGKGLLSGCVCMVLFSGNVADNLSMASLVGQFNSLVPGKAIICINEAAIEKTNHEALKQFCGSPYIKVEEKYQSPFQVKNIALLLIFSNDINGPVRLSGTESDKRFCVFSSETTIYKTVVRYMKEKEDIDMTEDEARHWVETKGEEILSSPEEVGRWLNHMSKRDIDKSKVKAFRPRAYDKFFEKQQPFWLSTAIALMTDPGFTFITNGLLNKILTDTHKGDGIKHGPKMRTELIKKYIERYKLPIEFVENAVIVPKNKIVGTKASYDAHLYPRKDGRKYRDIWKKATWSPITQDEYPSTDHEYLDDYGRVAWN